MLEDDSNDDEIPILVSNRLSLRKLYNSATILAPTEIENSLKSANPKVVVAPWYAKFIEMDQKVRFDIIKAVNYLDINLFLDLRLSLIHI